jgi:hypothetical protein
MHAWWPRSRSDCSGRLRETERGRVEPRGQYRPRCIASRFGNRDLTTFIHPKFQLETFIRKPPLLETLLETRSVADKSRDLISRRRRRCSRSSRYIMMTILSPPFQGHHGSIVPVGSWPFPSLDTVPVSLRPRGEAYSRTPLIGYSSSPWVIREYGISGCCYGDKWQFGSSKFLWVMGSMCYQRYGL